MNTKGRNYHPDGTLPEGKTWVFVFGSNLGGRHGAGAAKVAFDRFGARYGKGSGFMGRSYAIPTKDGSLKVLDLEQIKPHVSAFIKYAAERPATFFWVTRIGCVLAGYSDEQIAPLFSGAPSNCSFAQEWAQFLEPSSVAE